MNSNPYQKQFVSISKSIQCPFIVQLSFLPNVGFRSGPEQETKTLNKTKICFHFKISQISFDEARKKISTKIGFRSFPLIPNQTPDINN